MLLRPVLLSAAIEGITQNMSSSKLTYRVACLIIRMQIVPRCSRPASSDSFLPADRLSARETQALLALPLAAYSSLSGDLTHAVGPGSEKHANVICLRF